jgi:hypothetical protein
MAELRKYGFHVCPKGFDRWGCCCEPNEGEEVSATDDRDIQPLVEAARSLVAEVDQFAGESDSLGRSINVSWGPLFTARDALKDRLAPFNSKEDTAQGGDGEERNPYVRSTVVEAAIERLKEREKEAADRLDELRAERDPMGISQGSLIRYTEKRIYCDAILILADADYERHVLTAPGVAEAVEASRREYPDPTDDGSRLQELLEWAEQEREIELACIGVAEAQEEPEAKWRFEGRVHSFDRFIDRIHQLQANEEKWGEDGSA